MNLSQPQYDFLINRADWIVYGGSAGSGKTHALTLDPLRHVQGPSANAQFRGAIFRRTFPQLANPGGLLDHCREMYGPLDGDYNNTRAEFKFPCGAKIALSTIQFDKDLNNYQGAQLDWVAFDEATQFPYKYVQYLWGRCRSKSGIRPTLRMSCNPDNDSWLFKFLYWWISPETGLPINERSGVIRHFRSIDDEFEWHDEPQYQINATSGVTECVTTSATFIGATLDDNAALNASDPTYRQRLEQLSTEDRERFLNGNWLASSVTDTEWDRTLFMGVYCDLDSYPTHTSRKCFNSFAIDASKGKQIRKGDYSAISCVTTTSDLKYVDCDMKRRAPSEIVEDLFLFCDQEHHRIRSGDLIGIEALQFQSLFIDIIMRFAVDNPDYALSRYLKAGNIIIPVEDTLNKMMRIRRLDPFIKQRQFRFLQNPGTTLLVNQLKNFDGIAAKGKHDDGPDSLEMACNMPTHLQTYFENLRKPK